MQPRSSVRQSSKRPGVGITGNADIAVDSAVFARSKSLVRRETLHCDFVPKLYPASDVLTY